MYPGVTFVVKGKNVTYNVFWLKFLFMTHFFYFLNVCWLKWTNIFFTVPIEEMYTTFF